MQNLNTVGELLDYLNTQPRDRKIIMSSDAEGNSFSPLADADEAMYVATFPWSGEVYITPEALAEKLGSDNNLGYTWEDAAPEDAERVIVLGPAN